MRPISRPEETAALRALEEALRTAAVGERSIEQPGAIWSEQVLFDQVQVMAGLRFPSDVLEVPALITHALSEGRLLPLRQTRGCSRFRRWPWRFPHPRRILLRDRFPQRAPRASGADRRAADSAKPDSG